jgi:tRNA A-37 threonylcarbamoyl transferase component Bud32/tetratricopeptide (TPR) repeat protein
MGLDQVGKYKILGKIGQGAMGEVYRAQDPFLNRQVALKVVSPALGSNPQFRRRFEREAQSAAQLNHPNIITVFDFGEEAGVAYMAMELLEGRDLKDALAAQTSSLSDKIDLVLQICEGLAFAHGKGIIHRDLKPGNIHIQPNGQVKILDFGLARVETSEMTRTGTVLGTPYYMSPEQVQGRKAGPPSDVFSLGSIFYEALTGQRPFSAGSSHEIYNRILRDDPVPIRELAPDTPDLVAAVVERALSKDPAQRFADAGAMAATLRKVRKSLPPRALHGEEASTWGESDETLFDESGATQTLVRPGEPTVAGSTALAPDPTSRVGTLATTARPDRTTVLATTTAAPASRWPWIVAAVLVVGLGLLTWMAVRRGLPFLAPDVAEEQVGTLTETLVTSQIELAREDLANRDYEAAMERAQQALEMWQGNAEAQEVLDLAGQRIQERDAAVQEARTAWFEDGDAERATQALGRVMSLDPRHPVVGELSTALDNERFRQEAETARDEARQARTVSEREGAATTDAFSTASGLLATAADLFQRDEFLPATQKYLEARDRYRSAARAARVARATPSPPASPAPTPASTPEVTPATPPPRTATPPPTAAEPAPPEPTPARAPARVATPPPTPAASAAPTPDPRAGVEQAIERFRQALVSRDMTLYRAVMPGLGANEEERLREYFKRLKTYDVAIRVDSVQVHGDGTATAQISRQDTMNGRQGPLQQITVQLARQGGAWSIQEWSLNR